MGLHYTVAVGKPVAGPTSLSLKVPTWRLGCGNIPEIDRYGDEWSEHGTGGRPGSIWRLFTFES